eukprot:4170303-Prymnesium_polylepis.1
MPWAAARTCPSACCELLALGGAPPVAAMNAASSLQTFEEHCQTLYTASDPNQRAAAEAALVQLSTDV